MLKQNFNHDWIFQYGSGGSMEALFGGASDAVPVTLPHDASIVLTRNPDEAGGSGNGYFQEKNCVYHKTFELGDEDRNYIIEFEGVYQNVYVYVNNAFVGNHPYGYGNFYLDVTTFVHPGSNQIKVVVRNGVPSGRWYTGGGIYRDVNLLIADRLHITPDGVRLETVDVENDQAVVKAQTEIAYTGTGVRQVYLVTELIDAEGQIAAVDRMPLTISEQEKKTYQQRLYVDQPALWDDEQPNLYTWHSYLLEGETVVDEDQGSFGIRKLQLDRKHGLRVNGRVVKLRGGCIHHDNGITGTAEFAHAAEFRVRMLKEAGFNAIRSSHYPMSRRLLDACDKYGVYVMDEFADVWTTTKVDFDYGTHMADWWAYDVTNLVKKDYNHPCVIMYSIGNEIPEIGNKYDTQWGKKLTDKLRMLDPTRYVTNSLNIMLGSLEHIGAYIAEQLKASGADTGDVDINSLMSQHLDLVDGFTLSDYAGEVIEESACQVDLIGYNYAAGRYEKDAARYPNRIMVGSETYPRDLDVNWALVKTHPYVIGDFDWTAWDYLGEAGIGQICYAEGQKGFYTPYPYKAGYCGDINLIGDRRPTSYWREVVWGLRTQPYVCAQPPAHHDDPHVMSQWSMTDAVRSWNWKGCEGKPIIVEVYADADEAELFVNGKSAGRKAIGEPRGFMVHFDTIYEPGCVEAVVYKNGAEVGRDRIVTAADEVQLSAYADTDVIPADGSDIAYVEVSLRDADGVLNPEAEAVVSISIEGPGVIAGFGSADPDSEENYFDLQAKAYEGRLRAAIRGTGETGTITVTLTCGSDQIQVQLQAK